MALSWRKSAAIRGAVSASPVIRPPCGRARVSFVRASSMPGDGTQTHRLVAYLDRASGGHFTAAALSTDDSFLTELISVRNQWRIAAS